MLDSVLEWVLSFRMNAIQRSTNGLRHKCTPRPRGMEVAEPGRVPIPIARDHKSWLWPIPRCSSPIFSKAHFDCVEYFGKILSVADAAGLLAPEAMRSVATTGGTYKSYRLPLRIRGIDTVVWYCVGNRGKVLQLLKRVDRIGKKTSIGYGRVAQWEIERVQDDLSWFAPHESGYVLMRPLPAELVPREVLGCRPWYGAPCPPYWQRSLFCEIQQPM